MKPSYSLAGAQLLALFALAACGGGGGDPGTCGGSPEVCGEGQTASAPAPAGTTRTTTTTGSTTTSSTSTTTPPATDPAGGSGY